MGGAAVHKRRAIFALFLGGVLIASVWAVPYGVLYRAAAFLADDGDPASFTAGFAVGFRLALSGGVLAACILWAAAEVGPEPVRRVLRQRLCVWSGLWRRVTGLGQRSRKSWRRCGVSKWEAAAFSVVLLGGVLCRVLVYVRQPLYNDEAHTLSRYVLFRFPGAISEYTANNHPFCTLLANVAYTLGGRELAVLRLPALLAGVGVLVAVFALSRRRHGFACALLAMALAGGAGQLVDYSARIRGYSLVTLLVLLACMSALSVVASQGRRGMLGVGVTCALAHFTISSALFGTVGVFVYLFLAFLRTRRAVLLAALLEAGAICAALTLALYGPMLILGGLETIVSNRWVQPLTWVSYGRAMAVMPWRVVVIWKQCTPLLTYGLCVLGCLAAAMAAFSHRQRRLSWIPSLLVGVLAVSLATRTLGYVRTYNFLLPFVCAAGAAGLGILIARLSGRIGGKPATLMMGAAVLLALYQACSYGVWGCEGGQDDALDRPREAAEFLARETDPREPILLASPYDASIVYYGLAAGLDLVRTGPARIEDTALLVWDEGISYPAEAIWLYDLLRLNGLAERVYLLESVAQFGETHITRLRLKPLASGRAERRGAVRGGT